MMKLLVLMLFSSIIVAQPTFDAVDIGTDGSPRGYWEFLPAGYHSDTKAVFPVVIFFHGLGEGGNGTTDLHEVLKHGPPKMVNNDLTGNVFANNQVIMLAPQVTNQTWWNEGHIRPFFDHILNQYRIDAKRIYFTGLSAGSSGIHQFMNDDDHAYQVTAFLTAAVRGKIQRDLGAYLAELTPYWGLTARGDASTTLTDSANRMAGFLADIPATNLMQVIPNDGETHSASYQLSTGWQRQDGVVASANSNPLVTIYPGSSHTTWEMTYNNPVVWDWLFSHRKPNLTILSPANHTILPAVPINLSAQASDQNQNILADIAWYSDIDGFLGIGTDIMVDLSNGSHVIDAVVHDDSFRGDVKHLALTIDPQLSDVIFADSFEGL